MRSRRFLGFSAAGFHGLHYREWGATDAPRTVVCAHGLGRNAGDFDALAEALAAAGYRVACLDVAGRGESDWLHDPAGYTYPQYCADAAALIARLDAAEVDWVGTSMGGLIGMMLAAQEATPLRRLVLNDVGPLLPAAALARIAGYVGLEPGFADMAEAELYCRRVYAPFGALTDAQWAKFTADSVRPAEGGYRLHYDPRIRQSLPEPPYEDIDLWPFWDAVRCPTLVLRGAVSDLLLPAVTEAMTRRGPPTRVEEIAGCGHAPALLDPAQIGLVRDWLLIDEAERQRGSA